MAPPQPGGESGYEPFYPTNVPIPSSVKQFISSFFEISDDPDATDAWVRSFQDGATVVMGNETARGTKDIRKLRRRMWGDVDARKHRLCKVFPAHFSAAADVAVAPPNEAEFMLFGVVAYRLRDGGGDAVASWAAHAQIQRDGLVAPWRFSFYRVYIQK